MKIAICDSKSESSSALLEVLKDLKKKTQVFSDCFSLFNFFNKRKTLNDLVLMLCDEMFDNVDREITYFMKKFDLPIPIFTYKVNQLLVTVTMNYIYEHTKQYTSSYIGDLEKIKNAFLYFTQCNANSASIVSRFCEKQIFYNNENKLTANKSIFPTYIESNIESKALISSLNQQQKQLLSYLTSNYKGVNLEEIMLYIWKCNDESKKQNAYVLIHSLRKILESKTYGRYTIEKSCKKYRLVQTCP